MTALLEVRDLHTHLVARRGLFGRPRVVVRAVDGVSFDLQRGESLGLVGESGCGKTTLARTLLRLVPPTSGTVRFESRDILELRGAPLRALRRDIQIVFQDPSASLNPRLRVGDAMAEVLHVHRLARGPEIARRVDELLQQVGLDPALGRSYPHALSGGQRQRVGLARALAVRPRLLVCDEPVSALDASVQAQILNLLRQLQEQLGLTYLFISHDLRVVRQICQRVAVMYLGRIVEVAEAESLYREPKHPYTRALLAAVPQTTKRRGRMVLRGDLPSPQHVPSGCAFHPRCPEMRPECPLEIPASGEIAPGHSVACVLYPERQLAGQPLAAMAPPGSPPARHPLA